MVLNPIADIQAVECALARWFNGDVLGRRLNGRRFAAGGMLHAAEAEYLLAGAGDPLLDSVNLGLTGCKSAEW
jgi:hypothetical protein